MVVKISETELKKRIRKLILVGSMVPWWQATATRGTPKSRLSEDDGGITRF